MKLLKTSDELISHMKIKGIKFDIAKEEDAKVFLQNNNYYMKLASYRANYDKRKSNGEYINLDFAYLQELSTIDMHLRYLILQMCLDVEHALKTRLLKDIEDNPEEDGYDIIRRFVTKYERSCQNIQKHKSSEYCRELIEKYYPYFLAWDICKNRDNTTCLDIDPDTLYELPNVKESIVSFDSGKCRCLRIEVLSSQRDNKYFHMH